MSAAFDSLEKLPRARLGHAPTPLEEMKNLSSHLSAEGPRLWVKRDDCTGLALGGNKVRQLEFYLGEAVAQEADNVLITGAVQSNFVRLAAAGANQLGMTCHIQLEQRVPHEEPAYQNSGNVLLDKLLGAKLYSYPEGEDEEGADRRLREIAEGLKAEGKRPYVIPLAPGHKPLGALGYMVAAREVLEQARERDLAFDEVVVASGSGNTHGGMLFGLRALGCDVPVTGVCVRRGAEPQAPRIAKRCEEIAELLGVPSPVADEDVSVTDSFLAPGYGQLNEPTREAIRLAGQKEGLLLDPVYTAKTFAGFLQRARESVRENASSKNLLFIHTGGQPALFGYEPELSDSI
ncbi:MAG: D-cysteine desulfhydrase family protein [Pseudomonadota bacterium]